VQRRWLAPCTPVHTQRR